MVELSGITANKEETQCGVYVRGYWSPGSFLPLNQCLINFYLFWYLL